jgi:hypothetical protein
MVLMTLTQAELEVTINFHSLPDFGPIKKHRSGRESGRYRGEGVLLRLRIYEDSCGYVENKSKRTG